jgi:hypothetical protein
VPQKNVFPSKAKYDRLDHIAFPALNTNNFKKKCSPAIQEFLPNQT